jgi:hypothetical protein
MHQHMANRYHAQAVFLCDVLYMLLLVIVCLLQRQMQSHPAAIAEKVFSQIVCCASCAGSAG